ncbi:unnamed protein product, partial [marine sediment metagenome]
SPSAAAALVDEYQQKATVEGEKDPYQLLTDREREVLKLVVEGHTTREIADMLVVSPKTVEWYKASLMKKLNIHYFLQGYVRICMSSGSLDRCLLLAHLRLSPTPVKYSNHQAMSRKLSELVQIDK